MSTAALTAESMGRSADNERGRDRHRVRCSRGFCDPREEELGCDAATFLRTEIHTRQARAHDSGELGVVYAGDRDVAGNSESEILCGAERADADQVVRCDDGIRSSVIVEHCAGSGVPRRDREVGNADAAGGDLRVCGRRGSEAITSERSWGRIGGAVEERDVLPPLADQMIDDQAHRGDRVSADSVEGSAVGQAAEHDDRHRGSGEGGEEFVGDSEGREDHAVDIAAPEIADHIQ